MSVSPDLDHLLQDVVTLPSLPSTVAHITGLVNDPNATLQEVGQAISADTALALKTLRLVNSAYYGIREKVSSVNHAAAMLGMKVIKNLVFTAAVFETLQSGQELLLRHNVACGVAMKHLIESGVTTAGSKSDEAFIFGLLHDVGKIILGEYMPDETSAAEEACKSGGISMAQAERDVIGVDHAEIGAHLAQKWKLSDDLVGAIAGHHELSRCADAEHRSMAALLSIADYIAYEAGMGARADSQAVIAQEMWDQVGLSPETTKPLVETLVASTADVDELVNLGA